MELSSRAKSLQSRLFATLRTQPTRLLCPWDSPGKSIGVGCHACLDGIFPTQDRMQGSQVSFISRQDLYHQRHLGSPTSLVYTFPGNQEPDVLQKSIRCYLLPGELLPHSRACPRQKRLLPYLCSHRSETTLSVSPRAHDSISLWPPPRWGCPAPATRFRVWHTTLLYETVGSNQNAQGSFLPSNDNCLA